MMILRRRAERFDLMGSALGVEVENRRFSGMLIVTRSAEQQVLLAFRVRIPQNG